MTPRLIVTLAVVPWAALTPAAALAASASVTAPPPCAGAQSKYAQCDPGTVSFSAAAGEANRLTIVQAQGKFVFRDETAPVQAGSGCEQLGPREVRCTAGFHQLTVNLGDGDDRADGGGAAGIDGGPGNDTILNAARATGGPGDDVLDAASGSFSSLDGGDGADVLTGGTGEDFLYGGTGSDVLRGGTGKDQLDGDGGLTGTAAGGAVAADVLDGGDGIDTVSYHDHPVGVRINLADPSAPAGALGESDRLTGLENLTGSERADELRGDGGPNVIKGLGGRDGLAGGGSDDELVGGLGRDVLSGDDGNDVLDTRLDEYGGFTDRGERVTCGAGVDRVSQDDDLVGHDCETLDVDVVPTLRWGTNRIAVVLRCPSFLRFRGRCRGEIALSRPGARKPFARRRYSLGRGGGQVVLRLTRPAPSPVSVRVSARTSQDRFTTRWRSER